MIQHQAAPVTGILSGTGSELIRATVRLRAVPDRPPAELAEDVHPFYDSSGRLADWLFGSTRADHPAAPGSYEAYRSWRSGFASDRFVGERAFVTALLVWAAGRCDTSALAVLRLPTGRADAHAALTMHLQAGKLQQAVNDSGQAGLGLVRPDARATPRAFRAFLPTDPATVLLADSGLRLTAGPDGLTLAGPGTDRLAGIPGWRLVADQGADSVLVGSADGEAELTGPAAALLRAAGRHAPSVQVRQDPLASLVAPTLVALRDACALAGNTRSELFFRSAWS
ncbi:hypothetical protein [Jatrophihabitans sp.]|uniref:hypothetical protein n=1 Tax=Jatrophihabitans sp. TaxID=1932789 RepID=UPI002BEB4B00|nr:hypothetical protein [Jatrophihabitans sp.]